MRNVLIATAVVVALTPLAAQAQKQPAGPNRIVGTPHADVLRGGNGPDVIFGLGGRDRIWGNRSPDVLHGGRGNDVLHGFGSGNTRDILRGGKGHDTCIGTSHDVFRSCENRIVRKGLGPRRHHD